MSPSLFEALALPLLTYTRKPAERQAANMSETSRNDDGPATHDGSRITLTGEMSPGVKRMEALATHFTHFDHFLLLFGIFLVAYAYSLDYTLSSVYKVLPDKSIRLWSLAYSALHYSHMRLPTFNTIPS
jgi:hypothetical protein